MRAPADCSIYFDCSDANRRPLHETLPDLPTNPRTILPFVAFAGPYWIVAIDDTNINDPQWAIVAGGAFSPFRSHILCIFPANFNTGPNASPLTYPHTHLLTYPPTHLLTCSPAHLLPPPPPLAPPGPPTVESNGKCLYNREGFNGNGRWLFHRQPIAPASDVDAMRQIASDLGLDVTSLLPVEQSGCLYEGAFDPSV